MRRFSRSVVLQFDSPVTGNSGANTPVTVRDSTTGVKATLYSADDPILSNETPNPTLSDAQGNYSFFVEDGVYNVVINEDASGTYTLKDEQIIDLVALGTLAKIAVPVVLDQLVYNYPASTKNVFSVNVSGEYLLETDDGYTNDSVARTITLSEGLAENEVMEWETSLIPAPIFPEPLPAGFYGSVTYSVFGVDPTGAIDAQVGLQNAINFCSINQVKLLGQIGTYKCLSALLIPKHAGFIWESPNLSIIDSSAALTAFYTVDAYSDRVPGVSGDFTEGLRINGGRIIPSDVTGSYGMALFYVTNTSSIRDVEIRGGDNGLLLTKEYYGLFENFKIKDSAKIGAHLISSGTSDGGINANVYSGLFINGCENNLVFDDVVGSFSNVAVFNSCTFENSRKTSIIINGVRPVKFLGCYMEGNFSDGAAAGEVVEVDAFDSEVTFDTCFMNVTRTHDAGAFAVKGDTCRVTDIATYKRKGTLSKFYDSTVTRVVYMDDSPNADFSNDGAGYDKALGGNAIITQIITRLDSYTADRTIAPISGNYNDAPSSDLVSLVSLDLTTAQNVASWDFMVEAIAGEKNAVNPTQRGLSCLIHVSCWKNSSGLDVKADIFSVQEALLSDAGFYQVIDDGDHLVTIQYDGNNDGLLALKDIQWQIRDMVCRNNNDITSIDRL